MKIHTGSERTANCAKPGRKLRENVLRIHCGEPRRLPGSHYPRNSMQQRLGTRIPCVLASCRIKSRILRRTGTSAHLSGLKTLQSSGVHPRTAGCGVEDATPYKHASGRESPASPGGDLHDTFAPTPLPLHFARKLAL